MKEANFKETEIGKIPVDWEVKSIGEVAKELIRGPFGGALKKEIFVKSGYKVYEQRNAIYSNLEIGRYYIPHDKFKELQRFQILPKDFILSCSGTIGRIFQIPENFEKGIINQALLIIRLDTKINSNYFEHIFKDVKVQKKIIDDTQGGAMKNLVGISEFKKI